MERTCPKCKQKMIPEKYYTRDGSSTHYSYQYFWTCPSGIHDFIFMDEDEKIEFDKTLEE